MDVEFSEQQSLIRNSARSFLGGAFSGEILRSARANPHGYSQESWQGMAELGFMGICVPEDYNGIGGDFVDLLVLLEEMGRVTMPGPFFSTVVYATEILKIFDNKNINEVLLPAIATGTAKLAVAVGNDGGELHAAAINISARTDTDGYQLNGICHFVPDAHKAEFLLCAARMGQSGNAEDDIGLFRIPVSTSGLSIEPVDTMNGLAGATIVFDNASTVHANLIAEGPDTWPALEKIMYKTAVAKCAEMVGACARIIEIAVEHAKERRQFGKPIGSFQAIQHHCADMLTDLDSARWMMYKTGWQIDEGLATRQDMAMTKAWCNEACRRILRSGHQVMGGIGYCEEHDMPLFFRYIRMAEAAMGTGDDHLDIVAKDILCETVT